MRAPTCKIEQKSLIIDKWIILCYGISSLKGVKLFI